MRPVQGLGLLGGEAKHEIFRESCGVALDLFIQALSVDAVERGQVRIEDDALAVQDEDGSGDICHGRGGARGSAGRCPTMSSRQAETTRKSAVIPRKSQEQDRGVEERRLEGRGQT
jgi:hypothetical protein